MVLKTYFEWTGDGDDGRPTMLQRSVPLEQSGSFRRRIPSRYHLTWPVVGIIFVVVFVIMITTSRRASSGGWGAHRRLTSSSALSSTGVPGVIESLTRIIITPDICHFFLPHQILVPGNCTPKVHKSVFVHIRCIWTNGCQCQFWGGGPKWWGIIMYMEGL